SDKTLTLTIQDIPDGKFQGTGPTVNMAVVPSSGEEMDFANPSNALVVQGAGTIALASVDPDFKAGLTLTAGTNNALGALTGGAGTGPGYIQGPAQPVSITARTINVSGTIDVSGPSHHGTAGTITLTGKDITVDSGGGASSPAQLLADGNTPG